MSYTKKQPEVKQPEFEPFFGMRSYAWNEYAALLCGVNVGNDKYRKIVTPDLTDMITMHYYTRWLQDIEIDEINRRRLVNGIKYPIYRVAYQGNNTYTRVKTAGEAAAIEKGVDDGIKGNMAEVFAKLASNVGIRNIAGMKVGKDAPYTRQNIADRVQSAISDYLEPHVEREIDF